MVHFNSSSIIMALILKGLDFGLLLKIWQFLVSESQLNDFLGTRMAKISIEKQKLHEAIDSTSSRVKLKKGQILTKLRKTLTYKYNGLMEPSLKPNQSELLGSDD